jgi:hypothetical protein
VIVGVEQERIEGGKELLAQLRAFGERLPIDLVPGPGEVARAVRAAIRLDLAVVPVRPEAWFGYVMSRVSPSFVRRTTQPFRASSAQRLFERVLPPAKEKAG